MLTDEEKKELLLDMARNLSRITEDYQPYLNEQGLIMQSSPCIIKSTLRSRPAWSDGHIAMVYTEGDIHSQLPEWRAERWHQNNDSFDGLVDTVLASEPIRPVLYDDVGVWFDNTASIQRCFYDLLWIAHRKTNLRFEQDAQNRNSIILAYDDSGLIGAVMPRGFDSDEKQADIVPLIELLIAYHEYSTEQPCEKCGAKDDVWLFMKEPEAGIEGIPICHWCHLDTEGFQEWLVQQCEEALEANPDEWEKLPDGKWRKKEQENYE